MLNKNNSQPLVSLYEYLGKAAGKKLGKQVYSYAKLRKIDCGLKNIDHAGYKGKVMLYSREFLQEFFKAKKLFTPPVEDFTELNTQLINDNYNNTKKDPTGIL